MKKYRLELIRPPCIYCGACEKLCPQNWILNSRNDLKADIKKSIITNSNIIYFDSFLRKAIPNIPRR